MTFLDRIKETSTSTGTGTFTLAGAVLGYKVFSNGTYKYCIVNDTESEWEVGEGTVASGVLTRTTIEASSNGGAVVSFSAGTKQVFNTVSAAYVNSLVPYTGATASVNLGEYGLTAGQLTLDTSPTGTAVVGTTRWNDTIGSSETLLKGGNVLLKDGVDLVARVVNKVTPATTLTKAAYKAVRVSGAQGQRLAVAYAQANNDNNSADTIGLVCETIAANQEGFIITVGQLLDVNTTGSLQGETWADGDVLYLSPTTAGNLTNIKPNGSTGHIVIIGYVEYAHANNGKIYVKVMNGWELTELHDTYISSVANNDVLVYESSTTLWKNKSIATILGYAPQAAITLTTTGTSGAATLIGNTLNIPQYASGISGSGTAGQVTYWTGTSAVGGSSNFVWDNTNGRFGIGTNTPNAEIQITKASAAAGSVGSRIYNTTATGETYTAIYNDLNEFGVLGIFGSTWANTTQRRAVSFTSSGLNGFNIAIYNSSATANFSILTGTTLTERLRLYNNTGNLVLQNGGTFTDSGYRLDVNGTGASTGALRVTGGSTLLVGGGNTSATTALTVQSSASTDLFTVRNDGFLFNRYAAQIGNGTNVANGTNVLTLVGYGSYIFNFNNSTGFTFPNVALTSSYLRLGGGGEKFIGNNSFSIGADLYIHAGWYSVTASYGKVSIGTAANSSASRTLAIYDMQTMTIALGHTAASTAIVDIAASTTANASLRIRSGTAPTSPNDGDIWYDGTNIFIRVGGSTKTFTIV